MTLDEINSMDYWEARRYIATAVPRQTTLNNSPGDLYKQKQKGRKSNYHQFNLATGEMDKLERILSTEGLQSFIEVSLRAQSCPMPLNLDTWDGLRCPMGCRYCFADYFRSSLYTSFFDNGKNLKLRHCDPAVVNKELDKLLGHKGERVSGENEVLNAVRLGIPIRFGIRFEDFHNAERKQGISLSVLEHLAQWNYPTMINTKSPIPGSDDRYLKALSENKGKAAIHFTLISSDEEFLKRMEPGAPGFHARLEAGRRLTQAGVRVVARIEPWMMFINDSKDKVDEYIGWIKEAGVTHLTFDSYSYSANSRGLATNFQKMGLDWDRMFLTSSDSQGLSSLMLGKFMRYFRQNGLKCSTFDQGNAPENDDWVCCSVGDWFTGFNWGCGVMAIRFIQSRGTTPTTWRDFENWVLSKGGWLSSNLRKEVKTLWNAEGDKAWPIDWGQGVIAIGNNEDGLVWNYQGKDDFRVQLFRDVFGGLPAPKV